jgi:hypothetical protein
MRELNINEIVKHYLYAALWTAELDSKYDTDNFGFGEQYYAAVRDIGDFLNKAVRYLAPFEKHFGKDTESRLGHEFWLSRNGHGSGFFDCALGTGDKELEAIQKPLQEIANTFVEKNVFESEVGNVFIE